MPMHIDIRGLDSQTGFTSATDDRPAAFVTDLQRSLHISSESVHAEAESSCFAPSTGHISPGQNVFHLG